ncbi:NB-ARC domain-containing protein [Okeania sp. SIO3B5]|uniref:NB-ARC domain-containing protein n=1 Tax=Okeania sp. SIO3B5 TaxID=2607811 RepID=UPI0025FCEBB3|nr:NB-ARC domain-containing protein [Okeania sp. SIO3B5]
MGHRIKTWHPNEEENEKCWPYWLAKESLCQNIGIWSFGYEAEASAWLGNSQTLFDQGKNLLDDLENEELGQRPLIFITHSLGGLVVKEMLRSGSDYPKDPSKKAIIQNTKGIVFLATPHTGSDLTKHPLVEIMRFLGRENITVKELESHSSQLRSLDKWYRQHVNSLGISTRAYYEGKNTQSKGISVGKVVDPDSADPKIPDVQAIPAVDADHITIAKPTDIEDKVYKGVKVFIKKCLPLSDTIIKQLPYSPVTVFQPLQERKGETTENPTSALPNNSPNSEGLNKIWESMVRIIDSNGNTVGSGFMIHRDGYFVTCHHIIYSLNWLKVQYQDKDYQAQWCKKFSNPEVDIAILKINVKNAKYIPTTIPKDQVVSTLVCGFSHNQFPRFSKSFDVYGTLRESVEVNTISVYHQEKDVNFRNLWNKKPQDESTFSAYTIKQDENEKIDGGVFGGLVLDNNSGCAIGVIQSSDNKESYVISWENIIYRLKLLEIYPRRQEAFSTVTIRNLSPSKTQSSSDIYIPNPGYRKLLGREPEIERIKEVLNDTLGRKIVGVHGMGGIGKTALVREIIKSYLDVGFSKVLWQTASTTDNSQQMTFETVLNGIIQQLNRPELFKIKEEEREIKVRELLQERPVLIVLDNMETSAEPQDKIIQKLLSILGSSKALLTSRHRFTETFEDNVFPLNLRGLNKYSAIDLIQDTATQKNMLEYFDAVKDNKLEEMIEAIGDESFGYIPMALKFVLGQLQKFDPEVIIDGLKGVRLTDKDSEISDRDEFRQFWKYIFLTSLKLLSNLDKKFMSGMALFEPNIGSKYNQIMSTISLSNEEFRQVVNATWKVSFLEIAQRDSDKTYYLHRLSYIFFYAIISQLSVVVNK